jgi:hypothetical protein
MKTTFTNEVDYENQPKTRASFETDAVTLGDMLDAFEHFLKGCGFYFEGHLDIVEEPCQKEVE